MEQTILVNGIEKNIEIRPANIDDIDGLIALNQRWQRQFLDGDIKRGFLGASFDADTFKRLIFNKAVSVAVDEKGVASYMLCINDVEDGILKEHHKVAREIIEAGVLPSGSRISVGTQTAVHDIYQGTGVISLVRYNFMKLMGDRFDYLLTSISKENQRSYISSTKFGWEVVRETEEHYYLVIKI